MVKVFGHKSPDTDSICSAIVFEWILKQRGLEAKAYRLGELNKETLFILDKFGMATPELLETITTGDEVALVDTTNPDELISLEEAKVVEIVDHHKLCGLVTSNPLTASIKPLASTVTVMFEAFVEDIANVPTEILGLALACIISDTLMFRSPTTTQKDKDLAQRIAERINVSIEFFAEEMFTRKSDLTGMSAKDILLFDSKVFELTIGNTRVSVLETTNPQNALSMQSELTAAAAEIIKEERLDELLFFVVDILNEEATFIAFSARAKDAIAKTFGVEFNGEMALLPGVVSRKKQIVPKLSING